MKQNIVIWSFLISLHSGCTVKKTVPTEGCNNYKVVRNEIVGTLPQWTSEGKIYGVTLESPGVIVSYMDVVVLDSTGKQVTGVTSGRWGEYQIQLEPGIYQIKFNRVGYCTITLKDIVVGEGQIRELTVIVPVKTTY